MTDESDNTELLRVDSAVIPCSTGSIRIRDVNWTLNRGEFHVIGGLNWSGKTDLLTTLAGLQRPVGGCQYLFGVDIDSASRAELTDLRQRIGFVFEQDGRLFTDLNVAENLALPLSYHRDCPPGDVMKDVLRILRICGLETRATSNISELSRSLRRRVGLARALAMEPEVLLIDTPLGNSDPVQCRWWVDFLTRLHRNKIADMTAPSGIVVTVEDFGAWLAPERQFALLENGRFHQLGDSASLTDSTLPTAREMLTGNA